MKTHIRRKHGGITQSSYQKVHNESWESNYRVTTPKVNESYFDESSQFAEYKDKHHVTSFLDQILPQMRKLKEFKQLSLELNNSSPMIGSNILQEVSAAIHRSSAINSNSFSPNQQIEPPTINSNSFSPNQQIEPPTINSNSFSPNQGVEPPPPGSGTTLGYEAFVCERCLRVALQEVLDSASRRPIRLDHICNGQVIWGSRMRDDFNGELVTRKRFLIDCIAAIVTSTSQHQEKAKLIAVEVPGFGWGLHEEFIDLDPIKRDIPSWVYDVAQTGETMVDKTGLQEYLEMFGATLAYFRLIINDRPKFYFVFISNGLEPQHSRYIKRLFEPRIRTEFYSASKVPNRPQSTKLSDMISVVHVGKDSIPVLKLSPMLLYQTNVLSWHKAA